MNKPQLKALALKFLIYLIIGFAVAFVYRQMKN